MAPRPLILTLAMDDAAQARFNRLREAYFPPERNFIPAHITLFHALPGEECEPVADRLQRKASELAAFPVAVSEVRSIGRGVAYWLSSPPLLSLHADLAAAWREWLTPQDRQRFMPHIVVQNKETAEEARKTLAVLSAEFRSFCFTAAGLQLWRYLGGSWEPVAMFPFTGPAQLSPGM
jgi:2'-5' RNA ligase